MQLIEPLPADVVAERKRLFEEAIRDLIENPALDEMDDAVKDDYLRRFEEIYSDGYRQFYSAIHPILHDYSVEDGSLDGLAFTLETLREYLTRNDVNSRYPEYLYGCILKLSDHVNLEVQRLQTQLGLEKEIEDSRKKLEEYSLQVDSATVKLQSIQMEFIVVIGIFTAIVMAFSGGITLLGSSLNVIADVNVYKLSLTVLIIGFVVSNLIVLLLSYINSMVFGMFKRVIPESVGIAG